MGKLQNRVRFGKLENGKKLKIWNIKFITDYLLGLETHEKSEATEIQIQCNRYWSSEEWQATHLFKDTKPNF